MRLIALLSSSTLILQAVASSLTIQIPATNILPNPHVLPPNTHATLTTLPSLISSINDDQKKHVISAPLTHTAQFHFKDLPGASSSSSSSAAAVTGTESYLLDIRSKEYVFAPYRVDIAADGTVAGVWETFRGNQWDNRGMESYVKLNSHEGQDGVDVVVQAKVLGRRNFYEERQTCMHPNKNNNKKKKLLVFMSRGKKQLLTMNFFSSLANVSAQESDDSDVSVRTCGDVWDSETSRKQYAMFFCVGICILMNADLSVCSGS